MEIILLGRLLLLIYVTAAFYLLFKRHFAVAIAMLVILLGFFVYALVSIIGFMGSMNL